MLSTANIQKVMAMTDNTLETLRNEVHFELFWTATLMKGRGLSVSDPKLPRRRKIPRQHEIGDSEGDVNTDEESHYRLIYYEVLDHIIN